MATHFIFFANNWRYFLSHFARELQCFKLPTVDCDTRRKAYVVGLSTCIACSRHERYSWEEFFHVDGIEHPCDIVIKRLTPFIYQHGYKSDQMHASLRVVELN